MPVPQTDEALMQAVAARDPHALEALVARHAEMVRRHLQRTVRDHGLADDLLQEVFLRVWTRADQWSAQGPLRAWLCRIATNLALNQFRSARRRRQQSLSGAPRPSEDDQDSPAPAWMIDASALGPEAIAEQAEQQALLRRLVDDLPEEKREVFRMVHEHDMLVRDVARQLGIPEGTVKSRLHYATKRLARQWDEQDI